MDHIDSKVTTALRAIEAGGQQLVMQARQRVAKILDALDEGDFVEAFQAAKLVQQSLGPLTNAQNYIAVAGNSRLLAARELKTGMVLTDVGAVTDVTINECVAEVCEGHVKISIGAHEVEYDGGTELYVRVDDNGEFVYEEASA
jgi:hypothetical protein